MNKLCGISIAKNCVLYDYCIKENILSLLDVCDFVICGFVESKEDDGTLELIKSIQNPNLRILVIPEEEWDLYNGKERLAYITNIVLEDADRLGFQYVLYVQADEIIDPISYNAIRMAINDNEEGYLCKRINLWGSPYKELFVSNDRLPCSTSVLRLAKSRCRAYGDAESLAAKANTNYLNDILIWHMGFVRKRSVMKSKIINMQQGVFAMIDYDKKLDKEEQFNPNLWFNPHLDLIPIHKELPNVIKEWAAERAKDY